ncbi:MAG TPA: nucleoside triphosphate pyrophosphohydrolase [Longimicrobiales bacterium]|nr:nucleoside triphosphate pyrophosphohydrolase [Longimicrobiales bacterium]
MSEPTPRPDPTAPHFPGPGELDRALALVRFLRGNCPWDQAQTPETLIPHLLEEAHEVVDAIREGGPEELEAELGDLLLNLAFQIVLAEEEGHFQAAGVYRRLEAKMVRRHPHLFGDSDRQDWESLKAAERPEGQGVLSGLAKGLDPLTKAHRIQERVAGVGFDWDDYRGAWHKVAEELKEVQEAIESGHRADIDEELGDLLFAVVNLTRLAGAHSTTALDRANRKFHARFERLERLARERGIRLEEAGLAVLDGLWDEIKAEG